jgi:hypothetical protein
MGAVTDDPHPEQTKIAEDELSAWLSYPTELEVRPDEIELLGTVEIETGAGISDLFAFRFRTSAPHWAASRGWMVGLAGPYLRSRQPTHESMGHTFSRLAPVPGDLKSLEDHIADLVGAVGRFRSRTTGGRRPDVR